MGDPNSGGGGLVQRLGEKQSVLGDPTATAIVTA
jgi:hypothetical protein